MMRSVVELTLVMGGSGSAGAYAAGALDFILEALACLEDARAAAPDDIPGPNVRLASEGKTPAGAVNHALLTAALDGRRPPRLREIWMTGLEPRHAFGFGAPRSVRRASRALFDDAPLTALAEELAFTAPPPAPADAYFTLAIDPSGDRLGPAACAPKGPAGLFLPAGRSALDPSVEATGEPFAIRPRRSHRPGVETWPALSSTVLAGFGGYLDPAFRAYDFALGRRNAQRMLARHLTLPSSHPLVADWKRRHDRSFGVWPAGVAPIGKAPRRPLIPLTRSAAMPLALPAWPAIPARALRKLDPLIAARVGDIARDVSNTFLAGSLWQPLAGLAIAQRRGAVARETRMALEEMLRTTGQIAPDPPGPLARWFSRPPTAV